MLVTVTIMEQVVIVGWLSLTNLIQCRGRVRPDRLGSRDALCGDAGPPLRWAQPVGLGRHRVRAPRLLLPHVGPCRGGHPYRHTPAMVWGRT